MQLSALLVMIEEATYRVRLSILALSNRLPRRSTALKVTECLRKLERLNHNPLLLLVIPKLGITSQGEVLAQRVTIKAIIGHDTAEVGVAGKEHSKHIPHLTLIPQSSFEQPGDTGNRGGFIGVCLNTNTGVVANAEQVVNNLEPLVLGRIVDGGDIGDLGELGGRVVLQESHDGNHTRRGNEDGQFVFPDRKLLHVFGETRHDILAVAVEALGEALVFIRRVHDWGAEFSLGCNGQFDGTKQESIEHSNDVRGRWAWRMFGGSGSVDAFAAFCNEVEEKVRQAWVDLEADARERPVPSRIKERTEAMFRVN